MRHLFGRVPLEGPHQGQHLVQHDPQAEDVRAVIQAHALGCHLLGAHVEVGAHQIPGQGDGVLVGQLGETEIGDLGVLIGGDEDVGRFEVAVDDAGGVRHLQGVGHLRQEIRHVAVVVPGQLILLAHGVQGAAQVAGLLHQLHGDPVQALVFPSAVDRDDARVGKPAAGARLAREEIQALGIDALGQQQLQGHTARKGELLRLPDLSHAPAAEDLHKGEVAQGHALADAEAAGGGGRRGARGAV